MKEVMTISKLQQKAAARAAFPYFCYLFVHVVMAPYLAVRGLIRAKRRKYHGYTLTRLLGGTKPPSRQPWIVILAAGLGEARVAARLAQDLAKQLDGQVCVLVETSDAVVHPFAGITTGIAPFNSPISAWFFLRRFTPRAILSVEFLDNHHLKFASAVAGVPMIVFNVVLTEEIAERAQKRMTMRWRWPLVGKYAVLDQCHEERLEKLGVDKEQIMVSGPVGLGLPTQESTGNQTGQTWRSLFQLEPHEGPIVVAGSTWFEDETVVLKAFAQLRDRFPNATLVLAPRQLERADETLQAEGISFARRSHYPDKKPESGIILLDSIGELRDVYSIADIAFVGGTFVPHNGGHSPSEALGWNVPITLGPLYAFQAALVDQLVDHQCACVVQNASELGQLWIDLAKDPKRLSDMKCLSRAFLESQVQNGQDFFRQLTV